MKSGLKECKRTMPLKFLENGNVNFHLAKIDIGLFLDRVCTYYDPLPNLCPDLILLRCSKHVFRN